MYIGKRHLNYFFRKLNVFVVKIYHEFSLGMALEPLHKNQLRFAKIVQQSEYSSSSVRD